MSRRGKHQDESPRLMFDSEEEMIYSDEEDQRQGSSSDSDESVSIVQKKENARVPGMTAEKIDWDTVECVDEYGEDGTSSDEELEDEGGKEDKVPPPQTSQKYDDEDFDGIELYDSDGYFEDEEDEDVEEGKREHAEEESSPSDKKECPWTKWIGVDKEEERKRNRENSDRREASIERRRITTPKERRREEERRRDPSPRRPERSPRMEEESTKSRDSIKSTVPPVTMAEMVLRRQIDERRIRRDSHNRGKGGPCDGKRRISPPSRRSPHSVTRRQSPKREENTRRASPPMRHKLIPGAYRRKASPPPRRLSPRREEERRKAPSPSRRVSPRNEEEGKTSTPPSGTRRIEEEKGITRDDRRVSPPRRPPGGEQEKKKDRMRTSPPPLRRPSPRRDEEKRKESPPIRRISPRREDERRRRVSPLPTRRISPRRDERRTSPRREERKTIPDKRSSPPRRREMRREELYRGRCPPFHVRSPVKEDGGRKEDTSPRRDQPPREPRRNEEKRRDASPPRVRSPRKDDEKKESPMRRDDKWVGRITREEDNGKEEKKEETRLPEGWRAKEKREEEEKGRIPIHERVKKEKIPSLMEMNVKIERTIINDEVIPVKKKRMEKVEEKEEKKQKHTPIVWDVETKGRSSVQQHKIVSSSSSNDTVVDGREKRMANVELNKKPLDLISKRITITNDLRVPDLDAELNEEEKGKKGEATRKPRGKVSLSERFGKAEGDDRVQIKPSKDFLPLNLPTVRKPISGPLRMMSQATALAARSTELGEGKARGSISVMDDLFGEETEEEKKLKERRRCNKTVDKMFGMKSHPGKRREGGGGGVRMNEESIRQRMQKRRFVVDSSQSESSVNEDVLDVPLMKRRRKKGGRIIEEGDQWQAEVVVQRGGGRGRGGRVMGLQRNIYV